MKDYKTAFNLYLKANGIKLTNQRAIILDAIFSVHSHFDAESLFTYIRSKPDNESVSLTSIYRTLPLLLDAGLIKRSPGNTSTEQYEHVYGHPDHCHLECKRCGAILENKVSASQRTALVSLTERFGFKPTSVEIHFQGYCKTCLDAMKKSLKNK